MAALYAQSWTARWAQPAALGAYLGSACLLVHPARFLAAFPASVFRPDRVLGARLLWAALREVEFNVTKPAAHQLAISAMCLLSEGLKHLQGQAEGDDRLPAARASMAAVLEGAHDFRGIKALLHVCPRSPPCP